MDPHLRWLRRLVIARTAERLATEAVAVGVAIALGAVALDWHPADVVTMGFVATTATAILRLALAVATNPVNHRYLLRWTDPSERLGVVDDAVPDDDEVTRELQAGSFAFLARLAGSDPELRLDVHRAEGGRLVVSRSEDGEITVLSRLEDGRLLATSAGFIPPTAQLLAQRAGGRPGQIPTDAIIVHVEGLLSLRAAGVEAVTTSIDDVAALLRTEWEAWQELGPVVGPLIAVGWRRRPHLALAVEVPDRPITDLLSIRESSVDATPGATQARKRAESPPA